MRSFFPGLFILLAVVFSSCSKEDENQYVTPSLITLKTSIPLGAPGTASLSFDEVVSDSRCPANSLCSWAGIAIAKFIFTEGKESYPFMLSVMPGFPKQDTMIRGYHIEFSDLKPYPGLISDKATIQAEVRITKL
jgi:hypothetical protein